MKHAHRVAGISGSATAEFTGFADAVRGAGSSRTGSAHRPELVTEPPADERDGAGVQPAPAPSSCATGSREPHKNQRAVLHAAERLWREGLDFEVRLVGGARLERGRPPARRPTACTPPAGPLTELGRVSDAELTAQLRAADLVAFVSLHEGYGLPVAEALACGTPVLT